MLALAGAGLVSAQTVGADLQPTAQRPDNSYSTLSKAESGFLVKSARANTEQLAIARVAISRITDEKVRAFAQEMVAAYQVIDSAVTRLATAKTVNLAVVDQEAVSTAWAGKRNGAEFDRDYVKMVIDTQQQVVVFAEAAARDAKDLEVAEFARTQVSGAKDRLQKAEELLKTL